MITFVRKFFFFSFLVSIFCYTLDANVIDKVFIKNRTYYIQIGAYKYRSNISSAIRKLGNYDLYIEPINGLKRVQIVNIKTKTELKKIYRKIKKIYPKAFFSKKIIENYQTNEVKQQHFKSNFKDVKSIETEDYKLDSDTILKTRKHFL